jgi:hypothetical protein
MSRLGQAWLALSLSAVGVLPAPAQVTVDVSKVTCDQSTLARVRLDHSPGDPDNDRCPPGYKAKQERGHFFHGQSHTADRKSQPGWKAPGWDRGFNLGGSEHEHIGRNRLASDHGWLRLRIA